MILFVSCRYYLRLHHWPILSAYHSPYWLTFYPLPRIRSLPGFVNQSPTQGPSIILDFFHSLLERFRLPFAVATVAL